MEGKVVVTGMGTVNPIGNNVSETWRNLIKGVSGIGPVTLFDANEFNVRIAGEIKDFDPGGVLSAREVRRRDRFELFAALAAREVCPAIRS